MVTVDERGKPTGEGVIDFVRKGCAMNAVRRCSEDSFFLTSSLRPVIVESFEVVEDNDGYPEKSINRKNNMYQKEREVGPRFATPGSFEAEYGTRWKNLFQLFAQKKEALKKELDLEVEKMEAQMEMARYEHETEMLREQLRAREMDKERSKREWEMKERQAEEQRMRIEEQMRRQQEELQNRMMNQDEEMCRRQQENNLFMQAHNLSSILDQTEQAYDQPNMNNVNSCKSIYAKYTYYLINLFRFFFAVLDMSQVVSQIVYFKYIFLVFNLTKFYFKFTKHFTCDYHRLFY